MAEKTEARESEGWALSRRAFLQGALSLAGGAVVRPSLAAATPRLERLELVTDQAATGSGGNNWGGHQTRIVRTPRGVFTAYTVSGTGDLARRWRLSERVGNDWRIVVPGEPAGREPMNLLAGTRGQMYVIAWPDGLPTLWSASGTALFHPEPIPGDWQKTDWPYGAAGINSHGDIFVLQSLGEKPGELRWASRLAQASQWRFHVTATDYRFCYTYVLPGPAGALALTATRDVPWQSLGYEKPAGAFGYVFNAVGSWYTPNAAGEALRMTLVREETPTPSFPLVECNNAQGDTYLDTRGRLHILYTLRGASTHDYQKTRHAVLTGSTILKDVELPFEYGHYSRIIQDAGGRFYVFSAAEGGSELLVYPALSEDGTALGAPTRLDLQGNKVTYFGLALAAPRCGVPLANFVDGVFPSGQGEKLVYFRVRLSS